MCELKYLDQCPQIASSNVPFDAYFSVWQSIGLKKLQRRSHSFEYGRGYLQYHVCFAVLLDPLFLYIPIVNEDMKCLSLDNKLKKAAIFLRSITDILYILNIVIQFYIEPKAKTFRVMWKAYWRSHIPIDILAILPIPQVLEASFSYSVYL